MATVIKNFSAVSSAAGGQLTFKWTNDASFNATSLTNISLYVATLDADGDAIKSYNIPIIDSSTNVLANSYTVLGLTTGSTYSSILEIVNNGTIWSANISSVTVRTKPSASGILTATAENLQITLYISSTSLSFANCGFDVSSNIGAKLLYNTGTGLHTFDCTSNIQPYIGSDISASIVINMDTVPYLNTLKNGQNMELSFLLYNSLGYGDLFGTIIKASIDRPVPTNTPVAINTLEYNRATSTVGVFSYTDNIPYSSTVLFNKFTDVSDVIINYKIYRAIQTGAGTGAFSQIGTVTVDASGNQQPPGPFTYKSSNFDFKVVDNSNILVNTKYVYKVSASNSKNGEGLKSISSSYVKVGSKAQALSGILTAGANIGGTITIPTLPSANGLALNGTYTVKLDYNSTSLTFDGLILNANSLALTGLTNGISYTPTIYAVSVDENGQIFYGLGVTGLPFTPNTQPDAPASFTATALDASNNPLSPSYQTTGVINLSWAPVSSSGGAEYTYNIYRTDVSNNTNIKINGSTGVSGITYQDTTALIGTLYTYQVATVSATLESTRLSSSSVVAFVKPTSPTGLTITPLSLNRVSVIFQRSSSDLYPNPRLTYQYKLTLCDASSNVLTGTGIPNNLVVTPNTTTTYNIQTPNTIVYAFVTPIVTNNFANSQISIIDFVGTKSALSSPVISYAAPTQLSLVTDVSAQTFTYYINNNGNAINTVTIIGIPNDVTANILYLIDNNPTSSPSVASAEYSSSNTSLSRTTSGSIETWVLIFPTKISQIVAVFGNLSGSVRYTNATPGTF